MGRWELIGASNVNVYFYLRDICVWLSTDLLQKHKDTFQCFYRRNSYWQMVIMPLDSKFAIVCISTFICAKTGFSYQKQQSRLDHLYPTTIDVVKSCRFTLLRHFLLHTWFDTLKINWKMTERRIYAPSYPIVGSRQVWHIPGSRKNSITRHISHGHEYYRPSHLLICRSVCMPRETMPSFEVKKLVEPINTRGSRDLTRYHTGRRIRWMSAVRPGPGPLKIEVGIRSQHSDCEFVLYRQA